MEYWELSGDAPGRLKKPFIWQMPGTAQDGKTIFYSGAMEILGKEIKKLTDKKVLFIIGNHVLLSEAWKALRQMMEEEGVLYDIVSDIPSEPHFDTAERIALLMDESQYGAVIGIGGGSVMDISKLAAHGGDGRLIDRIKNNMFSRRRLPLLLLPTTSGTGSEVSPYIVLTINNEKRFFSSSEFLPTVAIVDPLLTVDMPEAVTAATAFDAMAHALEGSMACPSPYTECLAAESAALILKFLPEAIEDGGDIEARYYLSLASVMGMMSYVMGGGLYAHSISYILTVEKQQPHGLGCGLALPFTMAFNERYIGSLLGRLSVRCMGRTGGKESGREAIRKIQQLFIQSGLPGSLAHFGYTIEDSGRLARTLLNVYYRTRNPREMSQEDAEALFKAMITGRVQYF